MDGFEINDDGSGIKEIDFDIIAKRGTTSKIREYDNIYALKSLGFRGEALSSICNVANLMIKTKQPGKETGYEVRFDHNGNVVSKSSIAKNVSIF